MTARTRPQFVEVALWDDLRKLGTRYLKLANDARRKRCNRIDVQYLTECSMQAAAVMQGLSQGKYTIDEALDLHDVLERHLTDCRTIVSARSGVRL